MSPNPSTPPAPKKRVLVVDDEPGIRDMLKWHLISNGMDVETAEGGAEAIELIRSQAFSLVITDLTMPTVDGIQFLETLRREGSDIPVVIVTGFGTVESAVYAMKKGASDFILKPFDLQHLTEAIREIFKDMEETEP